MTQDCFRLIEPIAMDTAMPSWAPYFHQFDTVVGYSDLGHIFLADRTTGEHGVLYPFKSAAKSYGTFTGTAEFVNEVVREPGFVDYVLPHPGPATNQVNPAPAAAS